jgi:hypothetical protein
MKTPIELKVGDQIKDAYQGQIRTGEVVEDLGGHVRVRWSAGNRTLIRKDRVGSKPKKQGPWKHLPSQA